MKSTGMSIYAYEDEKAAQLRELEIQKRKLEHDLVLLQRKIEALTVEILYIEESEAEAKIQFLDEHRT